jgi:hypothetical protein
MAEKAYLIETEIFQGASQDILFQANNPKYADYLKKIRSESKASVKESLIWSVPEAKKGKTELWEDEIAQIKITTQNNCDNKEKFKDLGN